MNKNPDITFPWRKSATDLATDIAFVLTRAECALLIATLSRFLARQPEKFVTENMENPVND